MQRCGQSLGVIIQILRQLTLMLAPVVPFGMAKLWSWLGMQTDLWAGGWDEGLREIEPGRELGRQEILYPRLEQEQIQAEIDRLQGMLED